jgi:two-component system cell cycle sensor histidine kinase/response regulator CckA
LGLATVYGIMRQNQGHILVYSEQGVGTTFKLFFPSNVEMLLISATPVTEIPRAQGESVLLVEDDLLVLEMGAESLRSLGYIVYTADTPPAALSLAATQQLKFDLLITDVIMPSLNGVELARQVAQFQPNIKCLYMSGYPANFITQRGVLEAGRTFHLQALHHSSTGFRRAAGADRVARALLYRITGLLNNDLCQRRLATDCLARPAPLSPAARRSPGCTSR